MEPILRGRFAPSPSGRMHLGNLFSALLAWLSVRRAGGVMVLRMEDLDPDRCRPEYARQLADDLRWLGLDWDEGWQKGGPHGPYLQSQRTERYAAAFRALEEQGLLYPCYCTRAERLAASAPHRADGQAIYSGKCRYLTGRSGRSLPAPAARPGGSWCPTGRSPSPTASRGPMGKTCSATAGTSSSAAPTGCMPTSWRWCATTGTWGSPRWCGGGICWTPPAAGVFPRAPAVRPRRPPAVQAGTGSGYGGPAAAVHAGTACRPAGLLGRAAGPAGAGGGGGAGPLF